MTSRKSTRSGPNLTKMRGGVGVVTATVVILVKVIGKNKYLYQKYGQSSLGVH